MSGTSVNGRSDDGRKSSAVESHSGRHRSRSRDRRHRERSSSRHRSHRDRGERDRDRERDKERERPKERERDRERERERDVDRRRDARDDRDRDRHRRSRSRGHERDRDQDRDRRREKDREREDRDVVDRRRKRRDDSSDGDRRSETKRRKDNSLPPQDALAMDIDPKPAANGHHSTPPRPPSEVPEKEAVDRDLRSPTTSSRRSVRDRPTDYRSPRYDERDRGRDGSVDGPRSGSRGPPHDDRKARYDDRDPPRVPPPARREPPRYRRQSPIYDSGEIPPPDDDAEARSVFVSQLAARLTARDLGYFFEDKLGEGTVRDSRIVQDRISRRSKGIAYVELASQDLVSKAIALTGTVVMGLPIMVQLTESERNRQASAGDSLNLPPGVNAPPAGMQLYVGSLHFNLTESDIKQVFEPFGELDFVDLHKDPQTGRSKGYAFVQYKRADDAKMALEQMDGFELAGRQLRVNTVHEKNSTRIIGGGIQQDSLDEGGGTNLNSVSRQALMQKLARTETPASRPAPIMRPTNIPETMKSKNVLLKNMFNPEEETEREWHTELEADVKEECQAKYGPVEAIKVEVESQGEIYVQFDSIATATKALEGLNGRWFGGRQVSAAYISDAIMQAHQ